MSESEYTVAWESGRASVFRELLRMASVELNPGGRTIESYIEERTDFVTALRTVCAEYGDNDWEDDLNLSDILEKHLLRHLPL